MVANDLTQLPWYLESYLENYNEFMEKGEFFDTDAEEFEKDFMPLYLKYAGTKSLMKHLRNYLNTHEVKRKDDLRFQLVCMWCWHIQYYRERRGIPFNAYDVFKIRIPKLITNIR